MLAFLKNFTKNREKVDGNEFTTSLDVKVSCILVGDIHGRIDLLLQLLEKISLKKPRDLVFGGDYIDRGEYSADVLRLLFKMNQSDHAICLMGNHEKMLIDFLDNPCENGGRWLRNGGLQTLASFGVGGVSEASGPTSLQKAASKLSAAMGPALENWLRNLPLTYRNGNLVHVHAAADPKLPLSSQKSSNYLWGHPDFFKLLRTDGIWIAHGHTVVDRANAENGRISLDTGAYFSGRLTAAVIEKNKPIRFTDTK
ncbi:metallophosphoesterase family protein [Falsihalocynthiibacter sp. BN13B15]|uniref:metallophosphoesterase family protein n=1 Tax=Falsihalocynthiibacter sp. BN13B15 TaxID=3240871 RepID=UPI00350F7EFF